MRFRADGRLPEDLPFQVSLPTPAAVVATFVDPGDQPALEQVYESALRAELRRIQDAIPTSDLAVQWDISVEMGMREGIGGLFTPWWNPFLDGVLGRLARISDAVDADVPLGFHLCYGDFDHRHWKQPADTANLTEMANGILGRVRRPVAWVHMPVSVDRDDDAYFAPLSGLELPADTALYLGLVHAGDPVGTARRAAAAGKVVPRFGVATECGMGRTPRAEIEGLLALQAEAAAALAGNLAPSP
jgi:hypothetical protein